MTSRYLQPLPILATTTTTSSNNKNNIEKNNKKENQQQARQSRNASHKVYLHEMPTGRDTERVREIETKRESREGRAGPRCWQTNRRTITSR